MNKFAGMHLTFISHGRSVGYHQEYISTLAIIYEDYEDQPIERFCPFYTEIWEVTCCELLDCLGQSEKVHSKQRHNSQRGAKSSICRKAWCQLFQSETLWNEQVHYCTVVAGKKLNWAAAAPSMGRTHRHRHFVCWWKRMITTIVLLIRAETNFV